MHPPLAQLIVHAPTRPEALSGLRKALREFEVVGLPTNLDFCERVAGHRAFEEGGVTTAFLEEHGGEVVPPPEVRPPPPHAVVLASVAVLLEEVHLFFFFFVSVGMDVVASTQQCRKCGLLSLPCYRRMT